jgi:hypothetical protein
VPAVARRAEPACCARVRSGWFITAALVCLILSGCADSATSAPSTTPTYSVQLCEAAASYQTAANAIITLDAGEVGIEGVKKAMLDLQTGTNNLIAVAGSQNQFGAQLGELQAASAALNTTIAGLNDQDSLSSDIGKIVASVSAVEQAAKPIVDSLRTGCPAVPPAAIPPTS